MDDFLLSWQLGHAMAPSACMSARSQSNSPLAVAEDVLLLRLHIAVMLGGSARRVAKSKAFG